MLIYNQRKNLPKNAVLHLNTLSVRNYVAKSRSFVVDTSFNPDREQSHTPVMHLKSRHACR